VADRIGDQRPRLSSLPTDIHNTDAGDEVIEFARRFGMVLDDWQQWVVRHMCAERADGSWAATQNVLLVPRQAGKSAILETIEMAALFLWEEQHVIYSAHLGKTATDHMRRMRQHIKAVPEYDRLCRVLTGKGDERVERSDNGAILEFITRGKKSSRGGSPNRVIFDEAMFLAEDQIQAMLPAMSAQSMNEDAAAQMIYTSSAPIAESSVLHRLRAKGIEGNSPRMFFAEWSCHQDADPADRDNWYQANPGLGVRISEQWIEDNEFGTLSPHAFGVERLGIPEEPVGGPSSPIHLAAWDALTDANVVPTSNISLAVCVSPDRSWSSLGIAGRTDDGRLAVGWLAHEPGTAWIVDRCEAEWLSRKLPIRVHKSGPESNLIIALRERGIEVVEVASAGVAQSTGELIDAVSSGSLVHTGQPSMRRAIEGAVIRMSSDGAAVWSQRGSSIEITPLQAATVAVGGVFAPLEFAGSYSNLSDYLEDE
jgi:phage terminase large subunit-like protein